MGDRPACRRSRSALRTTVVHKLSAHLDGGATMSLGLTEGGHNSLRRPRYLLRVNVRMRFAGST